jgi:hypothetical protein
LLAVVSTLSVVGVCGCTATNTELVQILKTSSSSGDREKAAVQLAALHSVDITRQVVANAENDSTARQGLGALRDQYIKMLGPFANGGGQPQDQAAVVSAILDCLGAVGDNNSAMAIAAFVRSSNPKAVDLFEHGADVLASMKGAGPLKQLVQVVSIAGTGAAETKIRDVAGLQLQTRPDAVTALVEARNALRADHPASATIERTLTAIGKPAVEPLAAAMSKQDWCDKVLADIGVPSAAAVAKKVTDKEATVRYRAIGVLLRLYSRDPTAVGPQVAKAELVSALIEARSKANYADGRDTAAETVLAQIGKPAVKKLVAVIVSQPWAGKVLGKIGADAVGDLAAALTGSSTNAKFAAADALVFIQRRNPTAVASVTAVIQKANLKTIAAYYAYFIRLGETGTEEALGKALASYGTKQMATDYANCGNYLLQAAADTWATKHKYTITKATAPVAARQWGGASG